MTLQEKLKANTADLHNQLEQLMYVDCIMQKTLSLAQYQKLLSCNYLVHLHYEDELFNKVSGAAKELNLANRRKLNALEKDLIDADINPESIQNIQLEPLLITNEPFALGAMYVLEGATLGGSIIVKQLRLNNNFTQHFDFNYYNIYDKSLIANWQQFLAKLNTVPEKNHADVSSGALAMFNAIISTAKQFN